MSPRSLQELTKRRSRGGVSTGGITTIFDNFGGPVELKADFIFCFVGAILFLLLLGAAITNTRKLVGRERTPAVLLLLATLFFTVYHGMIFALYASGFALNEILNSVALQFNFTAVALMLYALFFFNNYTFELGRPSNILKGLPSRMWVIIIVGVFYFFATLENILASTILLAASDSARQAQVRAIESFTVLSRVTLVGISIYLFYCSLVRPRGVPTNQFPRTLRFVISPILILGTIVSLSLAIADIAISSQLNKAFESGSDLNLASLNKSQLQIDLGNRINEGLTNLLVVLITLSTCKKLWSGSQKTISQQPMIPTGPSSYHQQQPSVPQQQQLYAPYLQQLYQQEPHQQQPSYQNNNTPYQTSNLSSTPPLGMGYNGFNPYQQQHYPQQQQQQQPYGIQPGSPYQHPQASPSPPIVTDAK